MRPVREGVTAAGHAHPGLWRTPTPYLFLGFTVMMGLIAVALLLLFCTSRKPSGSSRRGSATEEASARGTMAPLDREPKVIVIMAGDDMPSFIACAKPFAFAAAVDAGAGLPSRADAA